MTTRKKVLRKVKKIKKTSTINASMVRKVNNIPEEVRKAREREANLTLKMNEELERKSKLMV